MRSIFYYVLAFSSFMVNFLHAQEGAGETKVVPQKSAANYIQTLIMLLIAVAFFYLILWRPEKKRRKAMEQKRQALKKGDKVTAMGIIGVVVKIKENSVILKTADESKIEVLKAAITDVVPEEAEVTQEKKEEEASTITSK